MAERNIGTNFKVAETGTESNEAGPVCGSFSDDTNVVNKQTNGWWFSNETSSNPPIILQYSAYYYVPILQNLYGRSCNSSLLHRL